MGAEGRKRSQKLATNFFAPFANPSRSSRLEAFGAQTSTEIGALQRSPHLTTKALSSVKFSTHRQVLEKPREN
jgi:hypothetical protein